MQAAANISHVMGWESGDNPDDDRSTLRSDQAEHDRQSIKRGAAGVKGKGEWWDNSSKKKLAAAGRRNI